MRRKVAFKTLGCRLNQFETDALVTDFDKAGYEVVGFNEKADIYIVNTCTVTNQRDRKSKYTLNQAVRSGANSAIVVATGCMVTNQTDYFENHNEFTYVVDNTRKSSIFALLEAHYNGEIFQTDDLQPDNFGFSLVEKGFHTRSAVKIQDGCNNFCTYCIVPSVRGKAISRPTDEIINNVNKLLDLGNKEIVLTGVNISRYDYNGVHFDDLVDKILNIEGDFRIRISSIEPEGFTDKLIGLFDSPKLCPHLHLCLQSGSDKVLLRMRRFYTVMKYLNLVEKFKKRYYGFNFTTDIIVGFPGETEDEFRETCSIVKEVGFSHIHTFKYSKRSGTRADRMPEQVPEPVKNERSSVVRHLSDEMKLQQRKKFIGKTQRLLVERNSSRGGARGYGENYIPILVMGKKLEKNHFYNVTLQEILNDKEKTVLAVSEKLT
jgi:threonylcarbamoyladenosine tRNA methylthiotransferase MtaB